MRYSSPHSSVWVQTMWMSSIAQCPGSTRAQAPSIRVRATCSNRSHNLQMSSKTKQKLKYTHQTISTPSKRDALIITRLWHNQEARTLWEPSTLMSKEVKRIPISWLTYRAHWTWTTATPKRRIASMSLFLCRIPRYDREYLASRKRNRKPR